MEVALLLQHAWTLFQVEKLIKELPSMLVDLSNGDLNSAEKDHLSNGISFQHTENGTNTREAQSMLLERIASEMNRAHLQFCLCVMEQLAQANLQTHTLCKKAVVDLHK